MFWVLSVYFNVRNILPKSDTFPPGHPVYIPEVVFDCICKLILVLCFIYGESNYSSCLRIIYPAFVYVSRCMFKVSIN